MDRSDVVTISLLSLLVVAGIAASTWHFWINKEYSFSVEATCDPTTENCFYRDCSIPDECPPNDLDFYKTYYVNAKDFSQCADNSCGAECEAGTIECEPVVCGESEDDVCSEDMELTQEPEETPPLGESPLEEVSGE